MAIPLLDYALTSQNQRVAGFEVAGDEQPVIYSSEDLRSPGEMDGLIQAAYLQIFHEQQMLKHNRQTFLESQLRGGQISVRDFVRGLVLSSPFRTYNYNSNSNYRFVELCVNRLLGRDVHNERETQAWSIVLATKGLAGFVDALLNGTEYSANFGDDVVPYQRRRVLPQRAAGELPHQRMPRYSADYRVRLEDSGVLLKGGMGTPVGGGAYSRPTRWAWQKTTPSAVRLIGAAITISGAAGLAAMVGAIALSAFGLISL